LWRLKHPAGAAEVRDLLILLLIHNISERQKKPPKTGG
jgi:hypothetical protein